MKTHIVSFSTGLGSAEALRRTILKVGVENTVAVFADVGEERDENGVKVCGEDDDQLRFMADIERALGIQVQRVKHPKYSSIWDVFFKERMMGSSQRDPCSQYLKRFLLDEWISARWNPDNCVLVTGIGWLEQDRADRWAERRKPWHLWFPLCEKPYWTNEEIAQNFLDLHGVRQPAIYEEGGYSHANCMGFCVKMGHWQAYNLWKKRPHVWAHAVRREEEFRQFIGKDISIMTDRRKGHLRLREHSKMITLAEMGARFASGYVPREIKGEGCAGQCMMPAPEST